LQEQDGERHTFRPDLVEEQDKDAAYKEQPSPEDVAGHDLEDAHTDREKDVEEERELHQKSGFTLNQDKVAKRQGKGKCNRGQDQDGQRVVDSKGVGGDSSAIVKDSVRVGEVVGIRLEGINVQSSEASNVEEEEDCGPNVVVASLGGELALGLIFGDQRCVLLMGVPRRLAAAAGAIVGCFHGGRREVC